MKTKRTLAALLILCALYLAKAYLLPPDSVVAPAEAPSASASEAAWEVSPGEISQDETSLYEAQAPDIKSGALGDLRWGNMSTLDDHFQRHGGDFNAGSAEEYAILARDFYEQRSQYQVKVDKEGGGDVRVYDDETNTFGAYNKNGTTKTFFKPSAGQAYFDRQPGKAE